MSRIIRNIYRLALAWLIISPLAMASGKNLRFSPVVQMKEIEPRGPLWYKGGQAYEGGQTRTMGKHWEDQYKLGDADKAERHKRRRKSFKSLRDYGGRCSKKTIMNNVMVRSKNRLEQDIQRGCIPLKEIKVGSTVNHATHGTGVVKEIMTGEDARVTFEHGEETVPKESLLKGILNIQRHKTHRSTVRKHRIARRDWRSKTIKDSKRRLRSRLARGQPSSSKKKTISEALQIPLLLNKLHDDKNDDEAKREGAMLEKLKEKGQNYSNVFGKAFYGMERTDQNNQIDDGPTEPIC